VNSTARSLLTKSWRCRRSEPARLWGPRQFFGARNASVWQREKLYEALVVFHSLGASAWIKRAQAEFSRIAPAAAGASTLTPTEARVAALVANGRTNQEVAAELFLSVKTVEANLSRV
jgi:DNA-binding CsgD family transcriptional regulator